MVSPPRSNRNWMAVPSLPLTPPLVLLGEKSEVGHLQTPRELGRCWINGQQGSEPKGLALGWWGPGPCTGLALLGPGSSLTVFFVDLHQRLVGLLCSC